MADEAEIPGMEEARKRIRECREQNLRSLNLSFLSLTSLPPEITQLSGLSSLFLEDNRLEALPKEIVNLRNLRMLLLHGNTQLNLPSEILGPTWAEIDGTGRSPASPSGILDYYFASVGEKGGALREIKVLVVGRGGAGKTSVIRRLKHLPLDPDQSETHGIAIEELPVKTSIGKVTARVWDFGGQHVLHAMHEFFFTGRSLYILVLGEREDMAERDAEYWLQLIRSYAAEAPVIVVLNKSGRRARELDIPRKRLMESYGPILSWVSTECAEENLEKGGIAYLEKSLAEAVDGMPEIRARFPKKWMQIKDWLSGMEESYLDYASYESHCGELGEKDPQKQAELASFLHDLGVALNYRKDPRLRETTVLRPDWLADGIYALMRANDTRHPEAMAPGGRLSAAQMPAIYAAAEKLGMLMAAEYPQEQHAFLLRLMAAFQLSFPLDEKLQEHLVPALLPVEAPEGEPWSPDGPQISLRWVFPVVPGPLLPRLLVRTFSLVQEDQFWRRGAVYEYGPATAKVWAENERIIYLRISTQSGELAGKEAADELLSMIRGSLRDLFREYRNLKAEEQVLWEGDWLPRRAAEKLQLLDHDSEDEFRTIELGEHS